MMKKARIENGVVREILTADPFPEFVPELVWIECGPEVEENWLYDGVAFTAPVPDYAAIREAKLKEVRAVREAILNRLAGIAGRAMRSGDTALASACDSASVALLDLPTGCPTDPALVDAFITNKYAAIRAGMPAALILAFAGVDA